MAKFEYDYYFGSEADQFRFLRIPKVFFEDPDYENLGSDEKILYGFLHEQVDLSHKKGWIDEEGRIYVMRSLESIQKILHNCSQDKARTTMKNLIEFGLIEKKRQGQGKPDLIYVKNFITKKGEMSGSKIQSLTGRQGELNSASQNTLTPENSCSEKTDSGGHGFSEAEKNGFLSTEKPVSRSGKFRVQETGNSGPKDIILKDTIEIETPSINQDSESAPMSPIELYVTGDRLMDGRSPHKMDQESYERLVKSNIGYDLKMHDLKTPEDRKLFDDLYNLIIEVLTGDTEEYRINKTTYPQEIVKSRFLKLTGEDLYVVMEQLSRVEGEIHNYRSYMISALFNAPITTGTFIMNDAHLAIYGENKG